MDVKRGDGRAHRRAPGGSNSTLPLRARGFSGLPRAASLTESVGMDAALLVQHATSRPRGQLFTDSPSTSFAPTLGLVPLKVERSHMLPVDPTLLEQ